VTGELLRITAPRAASAVVAAAVRAPVPAAPKVEPVLTPPAAVEPEPAPMPVMAAAFVEPAVQALGEIEQLAQDLLGAGARKVTVLGTASSGAITATALVLARTMARQARVVLVDLAGSSRAIPAVSVDPAAPGLIELMQGEASFTGIITRDQWSRLHLVSAGRPGADRSALQSPRLALAIDALLRVYDHVLLDAGNASDLAAELLTSGARAVVVPDASMTTDARAQMCEQLTAVGFGAVTMLKKPVEIRDVREPSQRGVAA
jgi:Mrp family chromosome partitioning ATPase